MKKTKIDYYSKVVVILKELKTLQPTVEMGKHLSTICDDGGWGMSDKELYSAFVKYKAQLELFVPRETLEEDFFYLEDDYFEDLEM